MRSVNSSIFSALDWEKPGTVWIDDFEDGRGNSYVLSNPSETLVVLRPEEIPEALHRLDANLAAGKLAAASIAYDAGLGFDKPMRSRHAPRNPLLWLGFYDECQKVEEAESIAPPDVLPSAEPARIHRLAWNMEYAQYERCVNRILEYIRAGDVYQVNFTCLARFENSEPPHSLFLRLRQAHRPPHAAFINAGDWKVISLSPELFLRAWGGQILARPMKGTMRRGRWCEEDEAQARRLEADEKNRAENLMIVDLMRNDLGRLCLHGTVQTPRLFHVERYPSLFQMTSDISGRLREGITTLELLRAVFPPGSVTGAPKLRALEIIDELEVESRGVYCGAIGLFQPGGDFTLNVAIRTIVHRGIGCELGLGGAIVADSDPHAEWEELQLKGAFLGARGGDCGSGSGGGGGSGEFCLLETLRLGADGEWVWLEEHLERMRRSALYFGWNFPEGAARDCLAAAAQSRGSGMARVRLLLDARGGCRSEIAPLPEPPPRPVRALLASQPTDPANRFLYHKTTCRDLYDAGWLSACQLGYFDLVHLNNRGEVTEGAISNLAAQIDGRWVTPPLECGLLPGLWRARRLAEGGIMERVIRLDDLLRATRIVLANSVRGETEIQSLDSESSGLHLWTQPSSEHNP